MFFLNPTFIIRIFAVFSQLSAAVGLTWITGFIIPYTGVAELGYLFIILNSLQGPVIFISFTCSRRVMRLWSGKLGISLYSTASTGSSSNDKTTWHVMEQIIITMFEVTTL